MAAPAGRRAARANSSSAIETRSLAPAIGVEILGLDLRDDLPPGVFESIRDAWHRNCVILFRDQTLDEAAQVAFARRFGELGKVLHKHNGRSSLPGVMYVSNIRENGALIGALPDGEMFFHSDQCYIEHPCDGTMLYCMETPSAGGNTLFANMFAAYEALPAGMKQRLEGLRALNVYDYETAPRCAARSRKTVCPASPTPLCGPIRPRAVKRSMSTA